MGSACKFILAVTGFLILLIGPEAYAFEDASGLQYEIGEGVPQSDVDTISEGIARVRLYIESDLGGDIPQEFREASVVKIVASGDGNQEIGGGGGCCTAFSVNHPDAGRIFLDVLHPHWLNATNINRQHHAAHEYTHVWQGSLGCLSISTNLLGAWLTEGIAEYVTYSAFVDQGLLTKRQVHETQYEAASQNQQLDYPLDDFSVDISQIGVWPGHIGYLAVAELVTIAPEGELSIRRICERVTAGETIEEAFLNSFGISVADFAEQFEPSRTPPRKTKNQPITAIIQLLLAD